MTHKLFYTNENLKGDLLELTRQMANDNFRPDIIMGPGRGGYVPGVMLSHFYGVPFRGFEWQTRDGSVRDANVVYNIVSDAMTTSHRVNILLVDDINDTGTTLIGIVTEVFKPIGEFIYTGQFKVATLFNKEQSNFKGVDFTARTLTIDDDPWIIFPYENWWNVQ